MIAAVKKSRFSEEKCKKKNPEIWDSQYRAFVY